MSATSLSNEKVEQPNGSEGNKSSIPTSIKQPKSIQELREDNETQLTQILRYCTLKTRNNREQNYQISMDVEEFSPLDDSMLDEEERNERKNIWSSLFYEQHLKSLHDNSSNNVDQQMEDDLLYFVRKKKKRKDGVGEGNQSENNSNNSKNKEEKSTGNSSTTPKSNNSPATPRTGEKNSQTNNNNNNSNHSNNNGEPPSFFVKRKHAVNWEEIINDDSIEWEQTFFLNLLLHRFHYTMEVSVRNKKYDPEKKKDRLITLKRVAKKVYATPSKVNMEDNKKKAETVEYTYPLIYFAIDDFDVAWKDIALAADGELVCVELFATGDFFAGPSSSTPWHIRTRLFAGALDYEVIHKEYISKKGMWTSPTMNQFFKLQGPNGKGAAQMAVCTQVGVTAADLNRPATTTDTSTDEAVPSPTTLARLGSAFRRLSFSNLAAKTSPVLNCSLTFLNMRWDLIIRDLLAATKKALIQPEKHTKTGECC